MPPAPLCVLHLTGSAVSEFHADLSLLYARDCVAAVADPARYDTVLAHVTPDRRWRFPASLDRDALLAAAPLPAAEAIALLSGLGVELVVPQMFCLPGMTAYRALFEVLGIPCLGNTSAVMALTAGKAGAKAVVAAAGVDVPDGEVLGRGDWPGVPPPAVVKPADGDNSLGVSLVHREEDYAAALDAAFAHSAEVLVERFVPVGREVRCGILERDGELIGLPLEEYRLDGEARPIRSHEDKIRRDGDGSLHLVAKDNPDVWLVDPGDPLTKRVWQVARRCHRALGCRHYSLFDFRVDPDGHPWFLEAGLYCSFAPASVIAVMARAAGIPLAELFRGSVREALALRA